MAAAVRLGRWHLGRTGTNPSVSTLLVRDFGEGPVIIGSGVTGIGGRPHAEAAAIAEAGHSAEGATAYVTLEPCAHHGRTPPCANALVDAGVVRVVSALTDPDERVSGAGYKILESGGIDVSKGCLKNEAMTVLGSYLNRSLSKRTQVTLKLAISADGMIGEKGVSQREITGEQARAQSHILRAEHDAIIIGVGTALADDPTLTCRLPGMAERSPVRIVLDTSARLSADSHLVHTADHAPLYVATAYPQSENATALAKKGVRIIACDLHEGRIALPELLEDLAAIGITRALVEGGAEVARAMLNEGLVERLALFQSDVIVGDAGVASPVLPDEIPDAFSVTGRYRYGADRFYECEKS